MGYGMKRSSRPGFRSRHIMPLIFGAFMMFSSPLFGGPLYGPENGTGGGGSASVSRTAVQNAREFGNNVAKLSQIVARIGPAVAYFKQEFERISNLELSAVEIKAARESPIGNFAESAPNQSRFTSTIKQLQKDLSEAKTLAEKMGLKKADKTGLFVFDTPLKFDQLDSVQSDITGLSVSIAMRQRAVMIPVPEPVARPISVPLDVESERSKPPVTAPLPPVTAQPPSREAVPVKNVEPTPVKSQKTFRELLASHTIALAEHAMSLISQNETTIASLLSNENRRLYTKMYTSIFDGITGLDDPVQLAKMPVGELVKKYREVVEQYNSLAFILVVHYHLSSGKPAIASDKRFIATMRSVSDLFKNKEYADAVHQARFLLHDFKTSSSQFTKTSGLLGVLVYINEKPATNSRDAAINGKLALEAVRTAGLHPELAGLFEKRLNEINPISSPQQWAQLNSWSKALLSLSIASSLPNQFPITTRGILYLTNSLKNPLNQLPDETAVQLATVALEQALPKFLRLSLLPFSIDGTLTSRQSTLANNVLADFSGDTPVSVGALASVVAPHFVVSASIGNSVPADQMLQRVLIPEFKLIGLVNPSAIGPRGNLQQMIGLVESAFPSSKELPTAKKTEQEVVRSFASTTDSSKIAPLFLAKVQKAQTDLLQEQLGVFGRNLVVNSLALPTVKEELNVALRNSQNSTSEYADATHSYTLALAHYYSLKGLQSLLSKMSESTTTLDYLALARIVVNANKQFTGLNLLMEDARSKLSVLENKRKRTSEPVAEGPVAGKEQGGAGTTTSLPDSQVESNKPLPGQRLYDLNEKPPSTYENEEQLLREGKKPTIYRYVPQTKDGQTVTIRGTVGAPQYTAISDPVEYEVNGKKFVRVTASGFSRHFNFSMGHAKPSDVPSDIPVGELRKTYRRMVSDENGNPKYVYEDRPITSPSDYKAVFIFIKYHSYTDENGDVVGGYFVYNPKHYTKFSAEKFIGRVKPDPVTGTLGLYADINGSSVFICPVTQGDRGGYKPVITTENIGAVVYHFGVSNGNLYEIIGVPLDTYELYPAVIPQPIIPPK